MTPPGERPHYWSPGAALPRGVRGYTRGEAQAAVGPGWELLAGRAWDAVAAEGARVVQVKEKFATLTVYWDGSPYDSPAGRRLAQRLAGLEAESGRTCEACGERGRRWLSTRQEIAELERATGRVQWWQKTLCAGCGYRMYHLGHRGWARIRGEWQADDDEDDDED